jgi:flagellar basal-body rod protein FlgB
VNGLRGTAYTAQVLELTLDALGLRQRVTAHNVANVETPGYKPYRVSFEQALAQALERKDLEVPLRVVSSARGRVREDGNGVDIEQEMVTAAKTSIAYQAVAQQWSGLYGRLRTAIREGRR